MAAVKILKKGLGGHDFEFKGKTKENVFLTNIIQPAKKFLFVITV